MKSARIGEASVATEPSVTSVMVTRGSPATVFSSAMISARLVAGKDAAIDVGFGALRQGVEGMAATDHGGDAGGADLAHHGGIGGEGLDRGLSAGLAAKARMAAPVLGSSSYFAAATK